MKVIFLGTGEAYGAKPNTSILINNEILLDCGPHTLMQLRKMNINLNEIKIIYISHFHGDHSFGLPFFLLACREEGRREKLAILGFRGVEEYIRKLLKLSYNKTFDDLGFKLEINEIDEGKAIEMLDYKFSFAKTLHSVEAFSISVMHEDKKISYTGDGSPTKEVEKLVKSSDLLIAEAYSDEFETHSSILKSAKLARNTNSKLLAIVHIFRGVKVEEELKKAEKIFTPILIPKEFDVVVV